jgi:hypothetical protein
MKKGRALGIPFLFFLLFLVSTAGLGAGEKEGPWPGVDGTVVKKFAKEQGREARPPVINTDQGDLLLFLFLLAGAVGGFAAGYYWRRLISEKSLKLNKESQR